MIAAFQGVDPFNFISAFTPEVWLAVLLSVIMLSIVCWIMDRCAEPLSECTARGALPAVTAEIEKFEKEKEVSFREALLIDISITQAGDFNA